MIQETVDMYEIFIKNEYYGTLMVPAYTNKEELNCKDSVKLQEIRSVALAKYNDNLYKHLYSTYPKLKDLIKQMNLNVEDKNDYELRYCQTVVRNL